MKVFLYFLILIIALPLLKKLFSHQEPKTFTPRKLQPSLNNSNFHAWIIERASEQCGDQIRNDKLAMDRLREGADKALEDFKAGNPVEINIPFLSADSSGPKHFNLKIDEDTMRKMEG